MIFIPVKKQRTTNV